MTRSSGHLALALALFTWTLVNGQAGAQSATAHLLCEVTENGKEIAAGTCGKELNVPAGSYTAIVQLDGALDGPSQQRALNVSGGSKNALKVDFGTGLLEIRITSQGKRAAGMAIIKKDGRQIGTLGSGVSAHLSAGSYQVVARYRTQEKSLGEVVISAGQHVALDASFD
jgi:hypothetical protein